MDLLIQFAQVGLGIACVIKEFVQKELDAGLLVEAPLDLTFPSREIGFVCKKDEHNENIISQLSARMYVTICGRFCPVESFV